MLSPVFRPMLRRRDMDSVLSCMVSDKVGPGDINREFSKLLTSLLKVKKAVSLSSY